MFHIHGYKSWQDVLVFNYGLCSYLLQARKCTRCNAARFRIVAAQSRFGMVDCGILREEHLSKVGFFQPTTLGMGAK